MVRKVVPLVALGLLVLPSSSSAKGLRFAPAKSAKSKKQNQPHRSSRKPSRLRSALSRAKTRELSPRQAKQIPQVARGLKRVTKAYAHIMKEQAKHRPVGPDNLKFAATKIVVKHKADTMTGFEVHVSYNSSGLMPVQQVIKFKADGSTEKPLFGVKGSVFGSDGGGAIHPLAAEAAKSADARAKQSLDPRSKFQSPKKLLSKRQVQRIPAFRKALGLLNRADAALREAGKTGGSFKKVTMTNPQAHYQAGELTHYTMDIRLRDGREYLSNVPIQPKTGRPLRPLFTGQSAIFNTGTYQPSALRQVSSKFGN